MKFFGFLIEERGKNIKKLWIILYL